MPVNSHTCHLRFLGEAEIPEYVPNLDGGFHRVFHRCRIRCVTLRHACDCMTHYIGAYPEYSRGALPFLARTFLKRTLT